MRLRRVVDVERSSYATSGCLERPTAFDEGRDIPAPLPKKWASRLPAAADNCSVDVRSSDSRDNSAKLPQRLMGHPADPRASDVRTFSGCQMVAPRCLYERAVKGVIRP
jgi:hypothetical protein